MLLEKIMINFHIYIYKPNVPKMILEKNYPNFLMCSREKSVGALVDPYLGLIADSELSELCLS